MNRTLLFCLCLLAGLTAQAQQTAYRDFEVERPAVPKGGASILNEFLTANVRKPFMAQIANVKGMVVVQGIVEPDGRIAEVTVIKPLRPDCDREAVRAFRLFNAWQPALKDGKPVRQIITQPVFFRATTPLQYENGVAIQYYDKRFRSIAPSDTAAVRSEVPTDTTGLPTGNLVFYVRSGSKWKKEAEMTYYREPVKNAPSSNLAFRVGHRDVNERPFGYQYEITNDGQAFETYVYDLDRNLVRQTDRMPNGAVLRQDAFDGARIVQKTWYPDGQLKQIRTRPREQVMVNIAPESEQMLAYWDSTGTQLVSEGSGTVAISESAASYADTSRRTLFTERGTFEKGMKVGRWTGQFADGSFSYVEDYDKGKLTLGKATFANQPDTVRYTIPQQQPEFKGGMQGLSQFLASTLRYPASAQRAGVEGQVFVSFVVCTDGTLCDFEVVKGVHPAVDAEAMRVVKAMNGNWKPGIQRGRPVRVKYKLPINFALR
ncbi:energy transducer TonB [Rudanella lutea]|uniref:energy transducer TonB n=1 Tax=Rudanella lutea TaxID=451374 RepID=UPI00036AFE68|nr:energy transducer TonB [Rudanella lutea]